MNPYLVILCLYIINHEGTFAPMDEYLDTMSLYLQYYEPISQNSVLIPSILLIYTSRNHVYTTWIMKAHLHLWTNISVFRAYTFDTMNPYLDIQSLYHQYSVTVLNTPSMEAYQYKKPPYLTVNLSVTSNNKHMHVASKK